MDLPNEKEGIKYHFIADDALPLTEKMLKPYPKSVPYLSNSERIFNYRLSRARRTIENAFGV